MKATLIVAAPYIAVLISSFALFLKVVYFDPFVSRRKDELMKSAIDKLLQDARIERTRILSEKKATREHKEQVTALVEQLERLQLQKMTERLSIVLD
jgi:hypothetical protein